MLNILVMIILIIISFIIILLFTGIKISLLYKKTGRTINGCLKILILKKIKIYSSEFPKKEDKKDKKDKKPKKKKNIKKIFELTKPCFEDLMTYLKSILKSLNISKLENHLLFGLDSYADTAKYIGIIWSVQSVVNNMHKNANITAEPSFNGSVLDMKGENEFEIKPLKLVIPTAKLISKKEVRTLIRGVLDEIR